MRGAERGRYAAARKIFGCLPHRQRDARVDERRVDLLSGAGALAIMQRREDARDREQARAEIRERHAGFPRRTARLAGDRHDARHALRHQIEAAFAARRPGLPVAGNRRVDQPRVHRRQRVVPEAERRHHAGTIVLD